MRINRKIVGNDGHEWVRWEEPDGNVIILDPAQNFIGSIEEAKNRSERYWRDYEIDMKKKDTPVPPDAFQRRSIAAREYVEKYSGGIEVEAGRVDDVTILGELYEKPGEAFPLSDYNTMGGSEEVYFQTESGNTYLLNSQKSSLALKNQKIKAGSWNGI